MFDWNRGLLRASCKVVMTTDGGSSPCSETIEHVELLQEIGASMLSEMSEDHKEPLGIDVLMKDYKGFIGNFMFIGWSWSCLTNIWNS